METINIKQMTLASSLFLEFQLRNLRSSLTTDNKKFKSKILMSMNRNGFSENKLAQNILHNDRVNFQDFYNFQIAFEWEADNKLCCDIGYGYDICFSSDFVIQYWNNTNEAMKELGLILDKLLELFENQNGVNEVNQVLDYTINLNDNGVISIT